MQSDGSVPLPAVRGSRGFNVLPLAQQIVVGSTALLLLVALLPAWLDHSAISAGPVAAGLRRPRDLHEAGERLARHYHFAWRRAAPAEQRVRLGLIGALPALVLIGAWAGRWATATRGTRRRAPLCFGNSLPVRAWAPLHITEEGHDADTTTL